jgi:signal transduction histidine kinase
VQAPVRPFEPGLQFKILLLALVAVGVTAVCGAVLVLRVRADIQAQVFQHQTALGTAYARVVQEYLDGSRSVLEGLADVPAVQAPLEVDLIDPRLHGIPATADPVRRSTIQGVLTGSGRLQSVIMVAPGARLYLVEPFDLQAAFEESVLLDSPTVHDAFGTGQVAWSNVVIDAATGRPTVVVEVPIKDADGNVRSLIGSSLGLQGLVEAAEEVEQDNAVTISLFDRQGVPIVYPDLSTAQPRQPLLDQPLVVNGRLDRWGSLAYYNPLTNQAELGTVVPLDNGWFAAVTQPESQAFGALNQTIAGLLVGLAVGMVVLLWLGIWQARAIAETVGAVARAAGGLALGHLDQQVPITSRDEVGRMAASVREAIRYQQDLASVATAIAAGDLSREVPVKSDHDVLGLAFQNMTSNLRTLIGQLEEQAAAINQALEREREARTAAEQAVAVRDRVLHSVSHDLRNPLAGAFAAAQLVRLTAVRAATSPDDPIVEGLDDVLGSLRQVNQDVDELVEAARLHAGQSLELHRTPTDLVTLTGRVVGQQQLTTSTPITFQPRVGHLMGNWDRRRLERVLSNLLANAIKYSPDGQEIQVTLDLEDAASGPVARLAVQDRGIGIPEQDLPHLFEWFHRAPNVGAIQGTGIGLASAAASVQEHQGWLEVTSQEGLGSTFTIHLPAGLANDVPEPQPGV